MGSDTSVVFALGVGLTLLIGFCLGSFATALAYRLPRGISMLSKARSACVTCHHDLGVLDLLPVFSWLFLKGRCRYCSTRIGLRYPLIEVATAALCLLIYMVLGLNAVTISMFVLAPLCVAIIDIDLHHKIIPDVLNTSIAALGVVVLSVAAFDDGSTVDFMIGHGAMAVLGALIYAGVSWALRAGMSALLKREPMGLGDVKFFAAAGFWLGPGLERFAWFMLMAGMLGIVLAVIWKKTSGEREFPFGPALVLGFLVVLLLKGGAFIFI